VQRKLSSSYDCVGLSNCRTIKLSDHRTVGLKSCRTITTHPIPVYECHEIIENAVSKTAVLNKPEKKRKPKNKNLFDSDLGKKREILISKGKLLTKFPFDPLVRGSYFKFIVNIIRYVNIKNDSSNKKSWTV
jgi:hypothetical protein